MLNKQPHLYLQVMKISRNFCKLLKCSFTVYQMSRRLSSDMAKFRETLKEAKKIAFLSGAGISAESGIPTFRGAGGLWRKYSATALATPEAFRENPSLVWEFYHYRREVAAKAQPNHGHRAIAEYEARHKEKDTIVITQNVDGLHHRAGSKNLLEIHGNLFKTRCTKCKEVLDNNDIPICEALADSGAPDPGTPNKHIPVKLLPHCKKHGCSGLLRPHIVWFGENLDPQVIASSATTGLSPKIMGGTEVEIDRYSFLALVEFQLFDVYYMQWCGGTLLTSTTVLSAAHCYSRFPTSQFRVRLGSSYTLRDGAEHHIQQIVIHPSYQDETFDGDVSILQLSSPARLANSVTLGVIAGSRFDVPDDSLVTALGWGDLYSGGPAPDKLHHVDIYTVNQDLCKDRYDTLHSVDSRFHTITPRMLCAGYLDEGGRDACTGDSGGPIVYRDVQGLVVIGVNSWGYNCGDPYYPGVYARVSSVSDWIVSNVLSLSYW